MKTTVTLSSFRSAFALANRESNFSYEGLEVLFNDLQAYEDASGEELELDVIGLCCDYTEEHYKDIFNTYPISCDSEEPTEDEVKQAVYDYLSDHTSVCGETDEGNFVYAVF